MNYIKNIVFLFIVLAVLPGCEKELDDYYYADTEETVDTDILSLLRQNSDYSTFVSLVESYQWDTVFNAGKTITVFVPTNEAFKNMGELYGDTSDLLRYLTSSSYINMAQVQGLRQIQTYGEKYAFIQFLGGKGYLDDVEISSEGPLCKNGKFYELQEVVIPKPNLYEYISATNLFYKEYIDLQDSSRLDPFSRPIGVNEDGETVYDTIWIHENFFEIDYFPVSQELRDERATMLLFNGVQLNSALEVVAEDLKLPSVDDIPEEWKIDVMMPYLINQSIFNGELGQSDFETGRVNNIQGDSVDVNPDDIDPESFQCSNGLAYNYSNFVIPEELYSATDTIHGYDMVVDKGTGEYTWAVPDVTADAVGVEPLLQFNQKLGKDVLNVDLMGITKFSVTIKFKNLFPGNYRFLCNLKSSPSGIFQIKVNGEAMNIKMTKSLATTNKNFIDLWDLRDVNNNRIKYFTGEYFRSIEGFRILEVLVDNVTEFGDVDVTFEYLAPSPRNANVRGIILDYLTLERWEEN